MEGVSCRLLRPTRPERQGDTHSQEMQLSDAHYHHLWLHRDRRYIGHEVEASTPVLRKLGTKRAWEASGATGYRAEIPES